MISNKSYNAITKTVKKVVQMLESHGIEHEVLGDSRTFAIAPSCSIHTQHCTIDIWKNEVKVNEKQSENLDHMIKMIQEGE
ncbi:hypothetical protein [Paenibacillus tundrae]|uniref:Uncharacterized protein n=1 Tax=Paenibacillus tundrae TaxID=528187 RepID=A0ABT9W689_9BACL|nr:hypothetical protein [Paenibacillus tundrae]MDQ0168749.1 hypothetical protein [Paenibacillus tundrae]